MGALKQQLSGHAGPQVAAHKAKLGLAHPSARPVPSPVQDLQLALELAYAPEPVVEKWPAAYRVGLLSLLALGPWAAIAVAVRALLR